MTRRIRISPRNAAGTLVLLTGLSVSVPPLVHAQTGTAVVDSRVVFGGPIQVFVNNRAIDFNGVPPIQSGSRVLVPLRGVLEALGATVDFDSATQTVFAVRGATQMQLRIGSTQATVNGQSSTLDVPAQARLGRTFVPLRFVSEALGATVNYDSARRTVTISAPETTTNNGPLDDNGNPDLNNGNDMNADDGTGTPRVNPPYVPPTNNGTNTLPSNTTQTVGTLLKVDATLPATITIRQATGSTLPRSFTLDANAQIYRQTTGVVTANRTPVYNPAVELSDLTRLLPGEEVRLSLNAEGQVVRVTSQVSLVTARVRFAQNNQIVLEDNRGTTLTIGSNLRFIDARGRLSNSANLPAGSTVALFIAPSTRRIYQVSSARTDIAAATNPTYVAPDNGNDPNNTNPNPNPNTNPNTNQGANGAPQITLVQHNAARALRAGATLTVTVHGTPNSTGSFSVLPGAAELPLEEDANRPGVYTGTYIVRAGENLLSGRVTAYLRNEAGQEALVQSRAALTIDTIAPRITGTSPANNATVASAVPNIVIRASDLGGSGLASATVSVNGQRLSAQDITISRNAVSFTSPQTETGAVDVVATVFDAAGNGTRSAFSFVVDGNADTGDITSITHNATRALSVGERIVVSMRATPGGRATFDVLGDNNHLVRRNVAMTENANGLYRGSYTIQGATPQDNTGAPALPVDSQLTIRGRFVNANGQVSTSDATAPIDLVRDDDIDNNGRADNTLTITSPLETDRAASPLTIRGTASPDSTVEVSLRAEGTRYLVLEYSEEMGAQQVQVGANGTWTTPPINLLRPRNVSGLRYIITATEIDASNHRSEPVTLTVTAR